VAVTGSCGISPCCRHLLCLVILVYGTTGFTPGPLTEAGGFVGGDQVESMGMMWSASGPVLVPMVLSQAGDMVWERGAEQWWAVLLWIAQRGVQGHW